MCSKPLIYQHILEVTYVNRGPFYRNREHLLPTKLCSKQFPQIYFVKNIQNQLSDTTHCHNSQHRNSHLKTYSVSR